MIFDIEPRTWQELQVLVAQTFEEIGCTVEIEKSLLGVRGITEIDVYVQDSAKHPPIITLCECKYWATSIPQTVVHAFRTVLADNGAHVGLIISKAGFQSGAYRAAEASNLYLYTWDEFQRAYEKQWAMSMSLTIRRLGYRISCYHGEPTKSENWQDDYWLKWRKLKSESELLYIAACHTTDHIMTSESGLPVQLFHPDMLNHPIDNSYKFEGEELITINTKREFVDLFYPRLKKRLESFERLLGPHPGFIEEKIHVR